MDREVLSDDTKMRENRDPNNLNPTLKVLWEDIVGEPEDLHTPAVCWKGSRYCYKITRLGCYLTLAVLCGPFIAFCHGCCFGLVAFERAWCGGSTIYLCKIKFASVGKIWDAFIHAIFDPLTDVCAKFFSKVQFRYQRVPDDKPPSASSPLNV